MNCISKNSVSYIISIFLLVLVIAISGCISSGGNNILHGFGQDLIKLSLDTEGRDTFDSLQPFTITVNSENIGNFDATNVRARLLGYGGLTPQTSTELLSNEKSLSPMNLVKPDPEKKQAGGTGTVDWAVYAPYVSADLPDALLTLTADVIYDTKSVATQTLVAATRNYITNVEARGEKVQAMPETVSTSGPVSIDVNVKGPYVEIGADRQTYFNAKISLYNDGTGSLYNYDMDEKDYLNQVVLTLPAGIGYDSSNCDLRLLGTDTGIGSVRKLVVNSNNNNPKLRMLEGGISRDLNCRLYVSADYVPSPGYNTFDLAIEANYTYIQQITKELTIKGTSETPLRVRIAEPAANSQEPWGSTLQTGVANEAIKFAVTYQNSPITSGLTASNFEVYVGQTQIPSANLANLAFADEKWTLTVNTAVSGISTGTYDLKLIVKYQGESAQDVKKKAVSYS